LTLWLIRTGAKSGSPIFAQRVGVSKRAGDQFLVLSVDFFNAGPADLVVILPLTSTHRGIPLHVMVRKGDGGTKNDSVVLCEAIRSVSKDRLISRWGVLSKEVMSEVEDRLRILLDL
jgi:mRNA interferase MazF